MTKRFYIALTALWVALFGMASAQDSAPVATPEPTPTLEQLRAMSREERIKMHQRRIEQIIQENKRRQEEEARRAAAARQQGVTAQPSAGGIIPQPGAPIPQGPVQVYTPPQQRPGMPPQATPVAQQPTAARSEARAILYFRPYDNVVVEGDTFRTDIVADCKEGQADEFSIALQFPSRNLNLLAVDFAPIADSLLGNVEYVDDSANGEIYFHFRLQRLQKFPSRPIATCYWEALAPTELAEVRFLFGADQSTDIRTGGVSILGTAPNANDGVVNSTVLIRAKSNKNFIQSVGERGLILTSSRLRPPLPSARLLLEPSQEVVEPGQTFSIEVVLDNPLEVPFDRVRLYLQFDPDILEVVDSDKGNWIRKGINVADGFAHGAFPFDFHRDNFADNERGVIVYEEACELTALRSHGPLVRIVMRAKQPARATDVVLVRNKQNFAPTTAVTYLSNVILTDYPQDAGVLAGVRLTVQEQGLDSALGQAPDHHVSPFARNTHAIK